MVDTKTGGWIVNVETRRKILFKQVGNTYYMDAWVKLPDKNKLPDKSKSKDKDKMDIDSIGSKKLGSIRPSDP